MTEREPHQANHLFRAVRYQLLQTVDAWLDLQPDQQLLLEVDEDFSVASSVRSENYQIKHSMTVDGPKPVSLRSAGIRTALLRYWTQSAGGVDQKPNLTFLATAGASKEAGIHFPDDSPGLHYWTNVANSGDTAPLRAALISIFDDTEIGAWLRREPPDNELRARLLRRVRFALNAQSDEQLEAYIYERVAVIYLSKGQYVDWAQQCVPKLVNHAFFIAGRPDASSRRLTAVDLRQMLEEAIPRAGALLSTAASSAETSHAVSPLHIRGGLIDRSQIVEDIKVKSSRSPIVWIEGAHGTGKSVLATLLARSYGGAWLVCDFRPYSEGSSVTAVLPVWHDLMLRLSASAPPAGVILDDLSEKGLHVLKSRLGGLAETFRNRGAKLIVTSNHTPSPSLLTDLGCSLDKPVAAPYFSIDEVRELVRQEPAPVEAHEAWAHQIHLTTSLGHPVLTISKLASLRARNWPNEALLEDLGPNASHALQVTRQEARRRLLAELPSVAARQLLERASAIFGAFEERLVDLLCKTEPAVPYPRDILAVLKGSWIENAPGGGWRLSPLIADLGSEAGSDDAQRWRRTAAEYWLMQQNGTLDAKSLPLCFWNAFLGQHRYVLTKVSLLVLELPKELLRSAASLLSPMVGLRTDAPLLADQPMINPPVRLLQICVADAVEDEKVAEAAAGSLLTELESVPIDEAKIAMTVTAAWHVFQTDRVRIRPSTLMAFLSRLKTTGAIDDPTQRQFFLHALRDFPEQTQENIDLRGILFARLISRITNSAQLEDVVTSMDVMEPGERAEMLRMANLVFQSDYFFVHTGWAKEQLENKALDDSLVRYERMHKLIAAWGDSALDAQFVVALSTIYDEGLQEERRALAVLDQNSARLADPPILTRQRSKVLARAGKFKEAADLFLTVENEEEGRRSAIERALTLREGGVACARAGLFNDAERLFAKSRNCIANNEGQKALAIGLLVEESLAAWSSGRSSVALAKLADAFDLLNGLVPTASRQNLRSHRYARAIGGLYHRDVSAALGDERPTIEFGSASMLEGDEEVDEPDLYSLADNWRVLEIVELATGADANIAKRSEGAQGPTRLLPVEAMVSKARYVASLRAGHVSDSLRAAQLTASIFRLLKVCQNPAERVPAEMIRPSDISELAASEWIEALQGCLCDLIFSAALNGKLSQPFIETLENEVRLGWQAEQLFTPLAAALSGSIGSSSSRCEVTAWYLRLLSAEESIEHGLRFARDLNLVAHLAASFAQEYLGDQFIKRIQSGWLKVLREQRFALRNPSITVPAVEAELAQLKSTGFTRADNLFEALADLVGVGVPSSYRQFLAAFRPKNVLRAST